MQFPAHHKLSAGLVAIIVVSMLTVPAVAGFSGASVTALGDGDDIELYIQAGVNSEPGEERRTGWGFMAWVWNKGGEPVEGYWNTTRHSLVWGKETHSAHHPVPAAGYRGVGREGFNLLPEMYMVTVSAGNQSLTKRAVELFGVVALSPPIDAATLPNWTIKRA